MRFIFLFLLLLVLQGVQSAPQIIPAVQQWTDSAASFTLNPTQCSFSVSHPVTETFRTDLQAVTTVACSVGVTTNAQFQFFINSVPNSDLKSEGYTLNISAASCVLRANEWKGIFYGTQTLLQLFKTQGRTIQGGFALDYPWYPLRAWMMDNGRMWVTYEWLRNHIREVAYLKLNVVHLHLSEWNNFRLQSTSHPEVTATQFYTKAQMTQLIQLADKYFVTIIPEFEMPGHMNWALRNNPSLQVTDSSGQKHQDNLDLTNPAAYTFVREIMAEFLPLFPGPYFHIGTDEYITDWGPYPHFATYAKTLLNNTNANAQDLYLNFVHGVNNQIRAAGKTTWVWNDRKQVGNILTLDKNIILDAWSSAGTAQLQQRYQVINSAQTPLYPTWYGPYEPWQTQLYENWRVNQWSLTSAGPILPHADGLLGAKLEWWFDNNNCEQYSMAWSLRHWLRTVAQKTWDSPLLTPSYTQFKLISDRVGHAPGTTFPNLYPAVVVLNGPYSAGINQPINFRSTGTYAVNGSIVSYRWAFGDGRSSTVANPSLSYPRTGNFKVSLLVIDSNGMTGSNEVNVVIGTGPPGPTPPPPTPPGPTPSPPPPTGPPQGSDLALGKPTTANTQFSADYSAGKSTDGNAATRWCARSAGNNEWLRIDLGSIFSVSRLSTTFESRGVWKYKIQGSLDGQGQSPAWFSIVDRTQNQESLQTYLDTLPLPKNTRYLWLTITETQPGHWASVFGLSVYL